jgi:uncharacterized protein (TIGR04255 family)
VSLDLPTPDRRHLADAPLDVVVCQLRYDNNLAVADTRTARALHDAVGGRRGQYPRVEQMQAQSLSVDLSRGVAPSVSTSPVSGWRFVAADGAWVIVVAAEHVSLETSAYTTWDDFRERLGTVLEAVAAHVDPAFEHRLGLRYIDRVAGDKVVRPADWETIIDQRLLGPVLHPGFGAAIRAAQQQLLLSLDADDEVQCAIRHGFATAADDTPAYVLDYDIYREAARPFDPAETLEAADAFNEYAVQLFQASLTQEHWKALT